MPDELQHYPFFPFRTGLYFEKVCELMQASLHLPSFQLHLDCG